MVRDLSRDAPDLWFHRFGIPMNHLEVAVCEILTRLEVVLGMSISSLRALDKGPADFAISASDFASKHLFDGEPVTEQKIVKLAEYSTVVAVMTSATMAAFSDADAFKKAMAKDLERFGD